MLGSYPTSLKPVPHSWIPARILPPYLQSAIGFLGVHVIMPLGNLVGEMGFLDSISLSAAIVCSLSLSGLLFVIYRFACLMGLDSLFGLTIPSVFLFCLFLANKVNFMPLAYPADLQENRRVVLASFLLLLLGLGEWP